MSLTKEKLNEVQKLRIANMFDKNVIDAELIRVDGTNICKINVLYGDGEEESFYPLEEKLSFILNGITLERN